MKFPTLLTLFALFSPSLVDAAGPSSFFERLFSKDFRYKTRRSVQLAYQNIAKTPSELKDIFTDVWSSEPFGVCEAHPIHDWAIPSIPEPLFTSDRHQLYDWAIPSIPDPNPRFSVTEEEIYALALFVFRLTAVLSCLICGCIGYFLWGFFSRRRQSAHEEEMGRVSGALRFQLASELLWTKFLIFAISQDEVQTNPRAVKTKLRQAYARFHPDRRGGNTEHFQRVSPIYEELMGVLDSYIALQAETDRLASEQQEQAAN